MWQPPLTAFPASQRNLVFHVPEATETLISIAKECGMCLGTETHSTHCATLYGHTCATERIMPWCSCKPTDVTECHFKWQNKANMIWKFIATSNSDTFYASWHESIWYEEPSEIGTCKAQISNKTEVAAKDQMKLQSWATFNNSDWKSQEGKETDRHLKRHSVQYSLPISQITSPKFYLSSPGTGRWCHAIYPLPKPKHSHAMERLLFFSPCVHRMKADISKSRCQNSVRTLLNRWRNITQCEKRWHLVGNRRKQNKRSGASGNRHTQESSGHNGVLL